VQKRQQTEDRRQHNLIKLRWFINVNGDSELNHHECQMVDVGRSQEDLKLQNAKLTGKVNVLYEEHN
jgi:hypothetical protein